MAAVVLPPTLLLTALVTIPLLGWSVAARHALIVFAMTALLVEWLAQTIHYIPFTRPYEPGHAKLRTRWWIYGLGLVAFAILPARLELRVLNNPAALLRFVTVLAAGVAALELAGRRRARSWLREESVEPGLTILELHLPVQ
jgi:hypothetical protein